VEDDPDEETLTSIVNKFGPGGVVIKVYKLTSQGKDFCFIADPGVNEEVIREAGYGPGRYAIHVEINGEFRKSIPLGIAAPISGPGASPQDAMTKMLLDRLAQLEMRLVQQPREREPISEITNAAVQLANLTKDTSPPWQTMMEVFKLGLETAKSGGDSSGGWLEDIAKGLGPALVPVIAGAVQRQQAGGGMAGQPVPPQPQTGVVPVNVDEQLKARLKVGIDFLKQMAIVPEADPGLWVDVIVARRNEGEYAHLIHKAIKEEFSAFVEIDPDLARPEYEPFFRAIHDGLRSVFKAAHPVDDDTKRPAGHKGNPKGNGRASA